MAFGSESIQEVAQSDLPFLIAIEKLNVYSDASYVFLVVTLPLWELIGWSAVSKKNTQN